MNLVKTSEKKLLLKVLFWRQAFKSQISETSIKSSEIQNKIITLKQQTFPFYLFLIPHSKPEKFC